MIHQGHEEHEEEKTLLFVFFVPLVDHSPGVFERDME
jgi:hypothetical protein